MSINHNTVLRKSLILILCLFMATMLSACWDSNELNEIGIISGSAYDWSDDKWEATFQVVNPAPGQGGTTGGNEPVPPFFTFSYKGKTIMETISRADLSSARHLYFPNSRIMFLSEGATQHGIAELIDVFLRRITCRETLYVFVTKENSGELLSQIVQLSENQAAGIETLIEQESADESLFPAIRLYELAKDISSVSKSAVVPEIELVGKELIHKEDEKGTTDAPSHLELTRLAVFKNDQRVGWLNKFESLGWGLLSNRIKSTSISFSSDPEHSDKEDATFFLRSSTSHIKPIWNGDHYVIDVHVKGVGNINEIGSEIDLTTEGVLTKMEGTIENKLTAAMEHSWIKIRDMDADPTQFAVLIHRKDPARWNQFQETGSWDHVFKQIEIRPKVQIKIKNTGMQGRSFKSMQQENK
ncbi:Ger(x)C family spore germination protein [Paenibacillus sp. Marseille-Q4541]|uniref:Ger(x)C family spore germination protein n=1 Tax=Paenibacillus sp. Marseille-Q4541 TaxID=2831522 RepID=UPI001BA6C1E9|nr:Ger(x)C family spore germination protein [Paenibacillus sp. Marseille-Q4541]